VIKYHLKYGIILELDTDEPDKSALYKLITPAAYPQLEALFPSIRKDLSLSHGLYGHSLSTEPKAVNLHHAMSSQHMAHWEPELIEGAEILAKYRPPAPLPPGAIH
jgi:hypothetical protein